MSGDDWKVGDLALCIKSVGTPTAIERGGVRVVASFHPETSTDYPGLNFIGVRKPRDGGIAWWVEFFRKINPLTDEERDEFLRELDAPVRAVMPLSSARDAA
jgi:hypothetical protein